MYNYDSDLLLNSQQTDKSAKQIDKKEGRRYSVGFYPKLIIISAIDRRRAQEKLWPNHAANWNYQVWRTNLLIDVSLSAQHMIPLLLGTS